MHVSLSWFSKVFTRSNSMFVLPAALLLSVLAWSAATRSGQQYADLATAFLHGKLYFLHSIGGVYTDPVLYNHHQYWSDGPFPAVVLLPLAALFSLFHAVFLQEYLDWLLVLATLYFVYGLGRRLKYSARDSLVLMFGFGLGSVFIGVAAVSNAWLYAQVLTAFLLFWSLYEYYTRKRWWLIGVLCGCIFLSRATAAAIALFFVLELWKARAEQSKLTRLLPIIVPVAAAIGLQALYNFLRFHSPLESGAHYQLVDAPAAASRTYGVFGLRHIPTNLFALLLGNPDTVPLAPGSWILKPPFIRYNQYGMSIFITSPYFLYLFTRQWAAFSKTARRLLIAAACSCLGVLCFYGVGRSQFGDRYSLDFLPELFVVLMLVYRKDHRQLSRGMKFLLLAAGVFNYYLLIPYIV